MNEFKQDIVQLIVIVVSVVLSTIQTEDKTTKVIISCLVVAGITAAIALFIAKKIKANKNLSNTAVISKSKKYTRLFTKLMRANEKALKKYINVRGFKKLEKVNKGVVRKIKHATNINDEKVKQLQEKLKVEYEDFYQNKRIQPKKTILKLVPCCSQQQAYEIYKIVQKNIATLRRILLQLEQHELRIKLGKFVVKYSINIKEQIESYLDDIGWTYILLGDNKKGLEVIRVAMNLIDYKISSFNVDNLSEEEEKLYYTLHILKARALRHLGTTYYTYKSEKDNVDKHLNDALEILNDPKVKKYYLESDAKDKVSRAKTYWSMRNGVEYNLMLYKYYRSLKYRDVDVNDMKKMYSDVEKMIKEIEADGLSDKHRYVKLLSFKSQLYTAINDVQFKDENPITVSEDLRNIESILNGNVYFDEAFEVYLYEKVEKAYDDVNHIFNTIK